VATLDGQVAIVTGAAMGIGRAIAEGLAKEGACVLIMDRQGTDQAVQEMSQSGLKVDGIEGDVTSEADTRAMAEAAVSTFGGINILVNNAGIYSSLTPGSFENIPIEEWRMVMDVNVMGPFLAARAVVPEMRKGDGGRIVNIASGTPFKGVPFLLHYVSSKGAVVALTRALAKEIGGDHILVNAVAPGFTLSDGVMQNPAQLEALRDVSAKARVIQRDQYPQDIVGAVKFLVGPDAGFITGQTIVVDGGAYFH